MTIKNNFLESHRMGLDFRKLLLGEDGVQTQQKGNIDTGVKVVAESDGLEDLIVVNVRFVDTDIQNENTKYEPAQRGGMTDPSWDASYSKTYDGIVRIRVQLADYSNKTAPVNVLPNSDPAHRNAAVKQFVSEDPITLLDVIRNRDVKNIINDSKEVTDIQVSQDQSNPLDWDVVMVIHCVDGKMPEADFDEPDQDFRY